MHHPPLWLLVLWGFWIIQAILSIVVVRKFAKRLARPRRHKYDHYRPRAFVIVPFKGIELDLAGCIRSFCHQDYPDYRLVFVVESEQDPAYEHLAKELQRHPNVESEIVIAGIAPPNHGQKVHNQFAAIQRIESESEDQDAWVFADSDAVPGRRWLADMIGPLIKWKRRGATTGYRWLVPTADEHDTIWSSFASVLNASAACFMGRRRFTYAWGGSMALLAGTARRGDLPRRLHGALTDDYTVTKMCEDLKLHIVFVPKCLVPTPTEMRLPNLVNFAHRQYLITRVYEPKLYNTTLLITSLFLTGFVSAVGFILYSFICGPSGHNWWVPTIVCAFVFAANQIRSSYRSTVVRLAFDQETNDRLQTAMFIDRWLTPVWMFLHWLFLLRAGITRTMNWRGIRYRLHAPNRVQELAR